MPRPVSFITSVLMSIVSPASAPTWIEIVLVELNSEMPLKVVSLATREISSDSAENSASSEARSVLFSVPLDASTASSRIRTRFELTSASAPSAV